jgi:hypothetical protein
MLRWGWWIFVVAACSDSPTSVQQDAPAPDAFADGDGDGIADAVDLCPALAHPNNNDRDSDLLGDACDPCPHLSVNTDGDGDGVGDLCDPHPTEARDRRAAFYVFNTSADITTWQRTGTWTVSTNRLTTNSTFTTASTIVSPDTFSANIVITAGINVLALSSSQTAHRTASIFQQRGTAPVMMHKCGLDQLAATAEVNYNIVNMSTMVGSSSTIPYPELVVANHDYKLGFDAMTATCGIDGPARTFSRPSGTAASGPIGINAELSQIAVRYIFVVETI